MAESVDALDLKSNRAYNPVPVQVWPGAFLKRHNEGCVFFCRSKYVACGFNRTNYILVRQTTHPTNYFPRSGFSLTHNLFATYNLMKVPLPRLQDLLLTLPVEIHRFQSVHATEYLSSWPFQFRTILIRDFHSVCELRFLSCR